jgi:hypothetical protein
LTVTDADVRTSFTATPTAVAGYAVTGRLAYENGKSVVGATVILKPDSGDEKTTVTGSNGNYAFPDVDAGTYTVRPAASDITYYPTSRAAIVPPSVEDADFLVQRGPGGNLDDNKLIELKDAIMAMQICARITPEQTITLEADVNGDGRINMAEVLYILQILAGYR